MVHQFWGLKTHHGGECRTKNKHDTIHFSTISNPSKTFPQIGTVSIRSSVSFTTINTSHGLMFSFNFDLPTESAAIDSSNGGGGDRGGDGNGDENQEDVSKPSIAPSPSPAPLHVLDIDSLNMKQCHPETWSSDPILISANANANADIDADTDANKYSLRRIAATERPFANTASTERKMSGEEEGGGGKDNHHHPNEDITNMDMDMDEISRQSIEKNQTDLIPGCYEGGLKVWECSIDLCSYLLEQIHNSNNNNSSSNSNSNSSDVQGALSNGGSTLELGCGHGMPAIMILKEIILRRKKKCVNMNNQSCPKVIFTDYNGFVLRDVTLPNIILNTMATISTMTSSLDNEKVNRNNDPDTPPTMSDLEKNFSLIAGDWLELSRQIKANANVNANTTNPFPKLDKIPPDGKFDLILASETTYTSKYAQDTAYLLVNHLKPNTGVGLVATKRYYFGVGGGSDAFLDACKSVSKTSIDNDYCLTVEILRQYDDGKSNIRDLWKVRYIPGSQS